MGELDKKLTKANVFSKLEFILLDELIAFIPTYSNAYKESLAPREVLNNNVPLCCTWLTMWSEYQSDESQKR